jgi:excisionase family DNA binding protein
MPAPRAPLLTVEEVRAELNIGRTLAYQLVQSGQLPVVRVGRAVRVRRSDFEAFISANVRRAGTSPRVRALEVR